MTISVPSIFYKEQEGGPYRLDLCIITNRNQQSRVRTMVSEVSFGSCAGLVNHFYVFLCLLVFC